MEKYQEMIEKMLANNSLKNKEDIIRTFLKNDFNNHKITENEYIELVGFLNTKLEELEKVEKNKKEIKPKVEENQEKSVFEEKRKRFCKSIGLKGIPILKVVPIYKGELGRVAPSRNEEK